MPIRRSGTDALPKVTDVLTTPLMYFSGTSRRGIMLWIAGRNLSGDCPAPLFTLLITSHQSPFPHSRRSQPGSSPRSATPIARYPK
jgi:hypothetical protein